MIVSKADRPACGGGVPGDRDVSAEADEDAVSRCLGCRASGAVRRQSFRGRAQVELDPGWNPGHAALTIELDPPPAAAWCGRDVDEVAVPQADEREGAIVPGQPERLADGRVDGPVGDSGRGHGGLERAEEVEADDHLLAGSPVQLDELGVVAEAAAGAVDSLELGFQHSPRQLERLGPANGDERGRSQRAQRRRGRSRFAQVAPETVAGGDDEGAGVWAGGAGEGVELPLG